MPLYDYKCDTCGYRFEKRQKFSSEPVATCPSCENRASRQFVPVPIVFKGSGFYVNDYGKKSSTTQASSNGASPESESKPEPKAKAETTTSSPSEGS